MSDSTFKKIDKVIKEITSLLTVTIDKFKTYRKETDSKIEDITNKQVSLGKFVARNNVLLKVVPEQVLDKISSTSEIIPIESVKGIHGLIDSKLESFRETLPKTKKGATPIFDPNKQPYYQVSASGGIGGTGLPSQTGNSGKYLTTDGTNASWASISTASALNVITRTLDYAVGINDDVINCDTTFNTINIVLPNPTLFRKPLRVKYTTTSTNTVTILPFGGESVDGGSSYTIANPTYRGAVEVISDGTNWFIY